MADEPTPYRPARLDDRAAWTRIAADPANATLIASQLARLDTIASTMPLPKAADFLAAKRSNDRQPLDDHWRGTRPNIARLAVNRLLRGIDANDPDDRLLNWTFAFATEPTWMVSAHMTGLPASGEAQLDLAACEAAGELAELREALGPWVGAQSPTLGDSIVRELDRRVIGPLGDGAATWWARSDATRDGPNRVNNWAGVCGGSVLDACLSLEATGRPRPACRDRMIGVLRTFFDVAFTPGGECAEGINYWDYGVSFACLPLMRMTRAELTDRFDVTRIALVASYPERCHLFGETFFAGNDSEARARPTAGVLPWLGELVGSDFLYWRATNGEAPEARTLPHLLRALQMPAGSSTTRPATPTHEPSRFLVDQQAAIFQRPSARGPFTFTVTGGTNDEPHNHNDLGTFQAFVGRRAIVPDLGAPSYPGDYFDDKVRYAKYLVAASGGHCCPAINGVEQRAGAEAAGRVIGWSAETGELSLDLTSAYPPEARLTRWTRAAHVPADDATAILTDEFELSGDGAIAHRIWFVDAPTVADGGRTIAAGDDLIVHVEPRPAGVEAKPFAAGDDRLRLRGYDAKKMLYRVDLTYAAKAGRTLVVTTRLGVPT